MNNQEMNRQPASPGVPYVADQDKLEKTAKNGANWFYWIAGLSLVNSVVHLTGSDMNFIFGLGITVFFDFAAEGAGAVGKGIALGLSAFVASVFVLFGYLAGLHKRWAFVVGMLVYALDGLIFVLAGDWLGVGVHAFALYLIFAGYAATGKLTQLAGQPALARA